MTPDSSPAPASPPPAPRGWTRREWLGATGAGLVGLGVGGCDRLSKLAVPDAVAFTSEIHILVWDAYFSQDLITTFEQKTSVRVNVHLFSSNDELPALLRDRKFPYDLAMPSAFMAKEMLDRGLLRTFNHANLPNLKEVDRKSHNAHFDPRNQFAVPYIWGATGIGYNARRVEGLPKSWRDLFRPRPLPKGAEPEPGKISILNDARFALGSVLIYLGLSPSTENIAEIEAAGEVLLRLRQQITHFESDRVSELLAANEVELAMAWSADVTRAMKGDPKRNLAPNKKVRISLPQEGVIVFTDNFVVPRQSQNQPDAERFLNYLLDPLVAGAVTNYSLYATTVPDARTYVDRLIVNGPSYFIHPSGAQKNFLLEESGADEVYRRVWDIVKTSPAITDRPSVDVPSFTKPPAADAPNGPVTQPSLESKKA